MVRRTVAISGIVVLLLFAAGALHFFGTATLKAQAPEMESIVRIHAVHLKEALDNLATVDTERASRIDTFAVMFNYGQRTPEDLEAYIDDTRVQMERARSMGYDVIPGAIHQIGRGGTIRPIQDYDANGIIDEFDWYSQWLDPVEWQLRMDQVYLPAWSLRTPGDNRFVMDFENYPHHDGPDYPQFKRFDDDDYSTEIPRMILAMKPFIEWVSTNNIHLMSHPGTNSDPLIHIPALVSGMMDIQDEATFFLPYRYNRGDAEGYANNLVPLEYCKIGTILGMRCNPAIYGEVMRDRSTEYREQEMANHGVDVYWVFNNTYWDKDGPNENWYTLDWFTRPPQGLIGGTIFLDDNLNGIQDNGEEGVNNADVRFENADGSFIGSDTTASDGSFAFFYDAGNFRFAFDEADLPNGYVFPSSDYSIPVTITPQGDVTYNIPAIPADAAESLSYTSYVQVAYDDLSSILDNLENVTGYARYRIDGFYVMIDYDPNDSNRDAKMDIMEEQINRARSLGYTAIPGLDWEPGIEIPDGTSSKNMLRYLTWTEESTYTTRINQYLNSLLGMRVPGDNRIAIDYAAEDLMYIDGSNPPSLYPTRNDEAIVALDVMYSTIRVWAQSNNVDLLLVPGGMHYSPAYLLSYWTDIVSIDPATLAMPTAYVSNPSQYAELTQTLSILQRAQNILQVPYQPMFSAEVLRDRGAEFRAALPNMNVSTFAVLPTDADGNVSDLFSSSWFSQP